jgi:hypothetical protein
MRSAAAGIALALTLTAAAQGPQTARPRFGACEGL